MGLAFCERPLPFISKCLRFSVQKVPEDMSGEKCHCALVPTRERFDQPMVMCDNMVVSSGLELRKKANSLLRSARSPTVRFGSVRWEEGRKAGTVRCNGRKDRTG